MSNLIDPNVWSFPRPGITGWRDRHEGPFWVDESRHHRWHRRRAPLKPYCVVTRSGDFACRRKPGFACCRAAVPGRRRDPWLGDEDWW